MVAVTRCLNHDMVLVRLLGPQMKPGSVATRAAEVTLVVVTFIVSLLAAEIVLRAIDGFELWSARLVRRSTSPPLASPAPTEATSIQEHAARIPLAADMKREWFDLSPPPKSGKSLNQTFERIAKRYAVTKLSFELFHVYNSSFIRQEMCSGSFRRFPFLFLYDPPAGAEHPRYRFPLNETTPYGLVTNQFGWRGPPIELRKPANTIRIAFVGASTTVNDHSFPYSYPELAGFFLDTWAQRVFGVRVEMINAGREGITSTDIAAIVRDEVLPLEPDLIVYYEGSNQLQPGSIVRLRGDPGPPPNRSGYDPGRADTYFGQRSALARRFQKLLLPLSGAEPSKPDYQVVWPPGVNEFDPPLNHKNLPASLTTIIHDLDGINGSVAKAGSELVVSSFFWLVYDGMKLDPRKHGYLYSYLNELYYPYRYRDMERLAAFQNRVLKKFAADRGTLFIDVASLMPRDPNLFVDAVHATYGGVRLHAWIAAQLLVPRLRERIESGRLPRPFHSDRQTHPMLVGNEHTLLFDCKPVLSEATTVTHLDLSKTTPDVGSARVEASSTLIVRIVRNARPHLYAARIPIVAEDIRTRFYPGGHNMQIRPQFRLQAQIKVTGGEARIGILTPDELTFLAYESIEPTKGFKTLDVPFWATSLGSIIIAAGSTHPDETMVELRDARIVSVPGYTILGSLPGLSEPPP